VFIFCAIFDFMNVDYTMVLRKSIVKME